MWVQEPLYDLPCISNVYNRKLSDWHYFCNGYHVKINRIHSEETKLKISKANKGKRLGCAPWNKVRKLLYIPGKREHTEETKKKMSEAAKRRWMQHQ
jgi:NUMOD3 motif